MPPPQGQNPFGQGQNPYGQQPPPPQGGYGYPPQQGAPYPPQGGVPGPPTMTPQPPRRRSNLGARVISVIVGIIVLIGLKFGGSALMDAFDKDAPKKAAVGDCVHNEGTDSDPDVKTVDCTSANAEFKVTGKVDEYFITSMLAEDACKKETNDFSVTYSEKRGSEGFTLCLQDNK